MHRQMYYTEEQHIPVFMLISFDENPEKLVEFYNSRTRTRETIPLRDFIHRLQMIECHCI